MSNLKSFYRVVVKCVEIKTVYDAFQRYCGKYVLSCNHEQLVYQRSKAKLKQAFCYSCYRAYLKQQMEERGTWS